MNEFKTIQFSQTGHLVQIMLAHPPLNVIGFDMMSELSQALDDAKGSQMIVISSSLSNFSTGVDVKIHTPELVPQMLDRFHDVIRKLYHFPGLTLCAVRGYALGGGMELALCCDVVVAEQASKIGFPEITIACFPPVAAVLLPRLTGKQTQWLLFSGEAITAVRSLELGIVDRLYEDDAGLEKIINQFMALSGNALRSLKFVTRKASDFDFDASLSQAENIYKEELLKSPDVLEGVQAFLEKRQPKFE